MLCIQFLYNLIVALDTICHPYTKLTVKNLRIKGWLYQRGLDIQAYKQDFRMNHRTPLTFRRENPVSKIKIYI